MKCVICDDILTTDNKAHSGNGRCVRCHDIIGSYELFRKMFDMVKEEDETVDINFFLQPNWREKKKWTAKQQAEFENWVVFYVKGDKQIKKALTGTPSAPKSSIEKEVVNFVSKYGWKVKI